MECGKCGTLLAVGLLAGHMIKQHDIYQSFVLEEDRDGSPLPSTRRWDATFYPAEECYRCPCRAAGKGVAAVV